MTRLLPWRLVRWRLSGLLPWLLVATACECGAPAPPTAGPGEEVLPDPSSCADGVAPLAEGVERGVCYAHNYQHGGMRGYGSETSRRSLEELRALGVEWVSLTPFGFMNALSATTVHHAGDHEAAETDARMQAEIAAAHAMGLRVQLKPHVWIRGGGWRGQIDPGSDDGWAAWFDSYAEWIVGYAAMAEALGVAALAVGVELGSSTRRFPERWRAVVARVRDVYRGRLVYCANWDEAPSVSFWDALDAIGVQFYPSIAARPGASEAELQARLATHLDALGELSERVGRPVVLTEIGYKSALGAAVRPHEWPEHVDRPRASPAEQARAYRAFFRAIEGRRYVRGVYWWKWFTDPDTDEEGPAGFSPRGKPAEAILRAAYGGRCPP